MKIKHFFDHDTATFSYVVIDEETNQCAIIDSVLNYDMNSGQISFESINEIVEFVNGNNLTVQWILETHAHADHLTGSHYLKEKLGGQIAIGQHIKEVLQFWVPLFNYQDHTPLDGSQFDYLLGDSECLSIGKIKCRTIHTPGHTPACLSYVIGDNVFVGDTIFMPDVGTSRADFPGGNAETLYNSVKRILSFPDFTKLYLCHDYPPNPEEGARHIVTVGEQNEKNIMINRAISKEEYIKLRSERDASLAVPRLLYPSLQVNIRAGKLPEPESNGSQYIKIPLSQ